MYNIWFCEIIYRDKREPFEIGGLDYLKLVYENIKEEYNQIQTTIESLEEQIEVSRTSLTDTSVLRGHLYTP